MPKLDVDRRETLNEYRSRIEHDFDASRKRLRAHGLPEPRMFAFPFSASAYPSNHPRIPRTLRGITFRHFATVFGIHGDPPLNVPAKGRYLHRLDVLRSTRTRDLLRELREARPPQTTTRRKRPTTRRSSDVLLSSARDLPSTAYVFRAPPGDVVKRGP